MENRNHAFVNNKTVARLSRRTQRLFSVKYLFGQANIAQNFLLLDDDRFFMHNARLILAISYDFLKLNSSHSPPKAWKKGYLQCSDSKYNGKRNQKNSHFRNTLNCI